jgi:spore germination protein YaaH
MGVSVFIRQHVQEKSSSVHLDFIQKTTTHETSAFTSGKTLFVPYWTISNDVSQQEYDQFIYFGISPHESGIDTFEPGYISISQYLQKISAASTLLAIRMTDKQFNSKVLDSATIQQKIITDSLAISKKYGFKGILLDFEPAGIGFDSLTRNVTNFITSFSEQAKNQHVPFTIAIYGDTFYRARPFDIRKIGSVVENIFILAYDFHKAAGDPGPNFPFAVSNADAYTFSQMIADFTKVIPKEKLVIVFGIFGYDWPVTEKGDSISQAVPVSTTDIEKQFVDSCSVRTCTFSRNASDEPSVLYIDSDTQRHRIWYEDMISVKKKIDYLHSQGIGHIAYWANGYF